MQSDEISCKVRKSAMARHRSGITSFSDILVDYY